MGKMLDPTYDEMKDYLEGNEAMDEYDALVREYDIEEAIYWYASDHHGGQGSNLYAAVCRSPFKPGSLARGPSGVDAIWSYNDLVDEYGGVVIDDCEEE